MPDIKDPNEHPPDPDEMGLIPVTPHENQEPVLLEEVEENDDSE